MVQMANQLSLTQNNASMKELSCLSLRQEGFYFCMSVQILVGIRYNVEGFP